MLTVRKTVAERDGMDFVLSDETIDRYGDIVKADGWVLSNFRKNPIALFAHDSRFPIGNWASVRAEGGKLIGRLELAARGTSARIDELLSLVQQGVLRAVSVGFQPIASEPIDPKLPWDGTRYLKQELLECSLCSVPANPAALQLAKSLQISDETMSLAFGEHAVMRRDLVTTGKHAAPQPPRTAVNPMLTLSQRIENLQNDLNTKRDRLTELNAADEFDTDAVKELTAQIEAVEDELAARKASEAKIGLSAASPAAPTVPAAPRRPLGVGGRELSGLDLLVRATVVRGISHFGPGNKSIDQVLQERYPGHEATAIVTKADQTIGTTTVAGWASEIVQTAYADFLQALTGLSIYPELRSRGVSFSFDGNGTVNIPSRTAGGAGGGFFAEGSPIRVGRITTASVPMTSRQMGVIVTFSRKLAQQSTPSIESVVRQAILEDTAAVLDPILLDAVAADTARPAGLLNGVAATASGFGGGDHIAVMEDFKALLAPFIAANAANNITIIMNPAQGLALDFMIGPNGTLGDWFVRVRERVTFVESTHATAGRLIALRNSDFATATGDTPDFNVSEQATVHMEDTTPLEIVSGTGPTTADPVRSLWQTGTIGIRMISDIGWMMRRSGMVRWIDGTSW